MSGNIVTDNQQKILNTMCFGAHEVQLGDLLIKIDGELEKTNTVVERGLQYWQPNTQYNEGQLVYVSGYPNGTDGIYQCITTHTSGMDFDLSYWRLQGYGIRVDHADESTFAQIAQCDIESRNITETYATKAEVEDAMERADEASEVATIAKEQAGDACALVQELEGYVNEVSNKSSYAMYTAEKSLQYWQPNTEYKVGQWVYVDYETASQDSDILVKCLVNHTSTSFLDDINGNGYWDVPVKLYAGYAEISTVASAAHNDINGNEIVLTYATKKELKELEDLLGDIGDIDVNTEIWGEF